MTVECGCAGVWFAYGMTRMLDPERCEALMAEERKRNPGVKDSVLREYVVWTYGEPVRVSYRVAHQLDGTWSTQARFVALDAEADPVTGFGTLREALQATNDFRREGYSFAA